MRGECVSMREQVLITDIQRFSVHDGPGIRTVIFFKGCPLQCIWCQNPETQSFEPDLSVNTAQCIGCGYCVKICKAGAIKLEKGNLSLDRTKCTKCFQCVKVCCTGARKQIGQWMTAKDILSAVMRDKVYYKNSNGGVTLSGGEPTAQGRFILDLLLYLRRQGIHTAMETCGYCEENQFVKILEATDLLLFDLKLIDRQSHRYYTGKDNSLIKKNLLTAAEMGKHIIIRVPLIQGVNDGNENLQDMARLARYAEIHEIQLLPFHQMGKEKWNHMDMDYQCQNWYPPDEKTIEHAKRYLEELGFQISIGGSGK